MRNKQVINGSGLSVASILGLIFIVLKLTNYIEWSWLWVLSPFWIPISIVLLIVFVIIGVTLIRYFFFNKKEVKK
jgi:hypothetical protein